MSEEKEIQKVEETQEEIVPTPDITATFLGSVTGENVNVKLFNDFKYTGVLSSIDGYMNVVLQNADEVVNGRVTNTYEEVFLRGNNVIYIGKV